MRYYLIWIAFILVIKTEERLNEYLVFRKVSNGFVEGTVSQYSTEMFIFFGLPYAKPPIHSPSNNLRFELPQQLDDKDDWIDVRDATKHPSICYTTSESEFEMSEDCLLVNIYSSKKCLLNKNCSILFYVNSDTLTLFDEQIISDNFANNDIVVVTANYRQNLFGFINNQKNNSFPTNLGLFDCMEALKWIHQEIATFGGNPSKVTISGYSKGAAIINALYLSPKSKHLFDKVLLISGARPISLYTDKNSRATVLTALRANCLLGTPHLNETDTIKCLKGTDALTLVNVQRKLELDGISIDAYAQDYGINSFFERNINELSEERDGKPLMLGNICHEPMLIDQKEIESNGTLMEIACKFLLSPMAFKNHSLAVKVCMEEYSQYPDRIRFMFDELDVFVPLLREAVIAQKVHQKTNHANGVNNNVFLFTYEEYNRHQFIIKSFANFKEFPSYTSYKKDVPFEVKKRIFMSFAHFIKTGNPSYDHLEYEPFDPIYTNYFDIIDGVNKIGYHSGANIFWVHKLHEMVGDFRHQISEHWAVLTKMDLYVARKPLNPSNKESYLWRKFKFSNNNTSFCNFRYGPFKSDPIIFLWFFCGFGICVVIMCIFCKLVNIERTEYEMFA